MPNTNHKIIDLLDKLIYFFSIIFLLSLTNSIFLNQLGYYLSLIFIAVRFYLTKENPFVKTGLEYALLFYITAEILSTIFSVRPDLSFNNLLKRIFLIPIIYAFIFSAKDFDRAKKFVLVYLGAALATMLVYLVLSYNYYVNNLYQLYESGPANFQYPITSSELMSFSLIFLFSFLINEKMRHKYKLMVLILFTINLLALLATYKRTGWMGAAAGILFVIALGRKWILLAPVILLLIAGAFIEKNISKVFIYDFKPNAIVLNAELNTEGRAYNIFPEGDEFYLSDFENGLLKYQNTKVIEKYNLGAPVADFRKWRDNFYVANLIDTRFVMMKKDTSGNLKRAGEFITPGFTTDWHVANGFVYALDKDSGLTVFRNPNDLKDKIRFEKIIGNENEKIFVDSSFIVFFSRSKELQIFSLKDYLPDEDIIKQKLSDQSDLIFYKEGKLIIAEKEGLKLYAINSGKIEITDVNKDLLSAIAATESGEKLFVTNTKGELFEIELPLNNRLRVKSTLKLGFVPKSIAYNDDVLFAALVKRNRLLGAVDLYIPSNFARLALWRTGWLIFKDYPLFGVGDIDLAPLYKQYKRNYDKEIQGHLHNNYIHVLATLGMFGFIAVMFLLVKVFVIHIKNYFSLRNEPFASSYALGAAGSFSAFLVSGLSEWNFGDHEIITMVWFMLALSIAFVNRMKKKNVSNG